MDPKTKKSSVSGASEIPAVKKVAAGKVDSGGSKKKGKY